MSQRLPDGQHLLQPCRWAFEVGAGRIDSALALLMHVVGSMPLDFCERIGRIDLYQRPECGDLRIQRWAAGKPFLLGKAVAMASEGNSCGLATQQSYWRCWIDYRSRESELMLLQHGFEFWLTCSSSWQDRC